MDIGTILAVYAAVLSTTLAAWSLKRHIDDRDHLAMSAMPDVVRGQTGNCETRAIVVEFENRGSRPVTVLEFLYVDSAGEHTVALPHPYPRYLVVPEHERREIRVPVRRFCPSEDLRSLCVRTATRQRFRCAPEVIRNVTQRCPWPPTSEP